MTRQLIFLLVLVSAWLVGSASAATFVVTNLADAGPGTLRQAILDANSAPGPDVIAWNYLGGEREIHLGSTLPEITDTLTLDGRWQPGYTGSPGVPVYLPFGSDGLVIAATNCVVRGMWLVNCGGGIVLRDTARGTVIGGTNSGDGNTLSYCTEAGVRIEGGSGHILKGNVFSANYGAGVLVMGGSDCLVQGNSINANLAQGVVVMGGTNHTIRVNTIFGNTGLGIDLGGDGVTLNDNDDPDSGPNQLQNFPIISAATYSASGLLVSGTLNSRPSRTYTLDFYLNTACDDSGNGEGERHAGSATVTTAGSGNGNFNITLTNTPVGHYVTATATDIAGNTSEFSPCVRFTSTVPPTTFTVTNVNDSGPGSLRQAILDSNARFANGANSISFNIPGTGVRRIQLTSDVLPPITEPVIINGYTQPGSSMNTASNSFNGVVLIRIDGSFGFDRALDFTAGNSTVSGLNIMNFNKAAIAISGADSNTISGNLIGVTVEGEPGPTARSDEGALSFYSSSHNLIGGTNAAARNVIGAKFYGGYGDILLSDSSSNRISGNFLGCDTTGTNGIWGGSDGVHLAGNSVGNVIGGPTTVAGNVFLGHYGSSIYVESGCAGSVIQGNYMEVRADGVRVQEQPGLFALSIYSEGSAALIGGPNAGEGNVVGGYVLLAGGQGNAVLRNSLLAHDSVGIDLGSDGFTPNDADDSDIGANGLQNYPEILSATVYPSRTLVRSHLQSKPIATYRIDFYESDRLPPSGYAEAKTWIGTTNVTLGGSGLATFDWSPATTLMPGHWVTATATDPANNTSELAPPAVVALSNTVNLVVSLNAPDAPVSRTSNFTYTVEVRNLGPTNATGVVLSNLLPANVSFISASASQGSCAQAAGVVMCSLGGLVSGGLATVVLTVHPESNGPAVLTAIASANQAEAYDGDNAATGSPFAGVADVDVLTGSFAPRPVIAGQQFDTLVTITNRGPDPAFVRVDVTWSEPDVPVSITTPLGTVPVPSPAMFADADVGLLPAGGFAFISARTLNPWAANNVSGGIFVHVVGDAFDPDNLDYFEGNAPVAPGPGVLTFQNSMQRVGESEGVAALRVLRYGGALGSVTVDYAVNTGTATPGVDYTPVSGTLVFFSGQTEKCIYVPVHEDLETEWGESFTVSLSNPTGGATWLYNGISNCVVHILDDDPALRGVVAGVSVTATNPVAAGAWPSERVSVSDDGRYVSFQSLSPDLVAGDTADSYDVFVRDLVTGTTVLGSVSRFGTNGANNWGIDDAQLSSDGRHLVFVSAADNLVTNENPSSYAQVYLRDLAAGTTKLLSVSAGSNAASQGNSRNSSITSNALGVTFESDAPDLSATWDANNLRDVFFHDVTAGVTHLVSVNRWGTGGGNGESSLPYPVNYPGYRPHGRFVGFSSLASDLVTGDNNASLDAFVRDLTNGVTTLVSINQSGTGSGNGASSDPLLSADGRYALFQSEASDLVAGDTNGAADVFLRDLVAGTTRLVSVNRFDTGSANASSTHRGLSRDGRFALFESPASDLVPNDNNGYSDVFVRDLLTDTTMLISFNCDGNGTAAGSSSFSSISSDGRYVAFVSDAPDVVRGAGGPGHAYLRDLVTGTTRLLSANWRGSVSPSGACDWTLVADGAGTVAFISSANDLLPIDGNGGTDVFAWRPVSSNTVDLVVEQTDSPDPVRPGSNVTYTVTVLNRGLTNASSVVLSDTIPAGATFISVTSSQGSCSNSAGVVTCSLGGISAGALATVAITVQVATPGTAVNFATANAAELEAVPENNSSSETTCVPSAARPVLAVAAVPGCLLINTVPCAPLDCVLEGTVNLSEGGVWAAISATVIAQGEVRTFVVPLDVPQRFFRLRCP